MGVFDISREVGALKKAAINAYMTDNGYRRVPEENLYRYVSREFERAPLSRTNPSGPPSISK